MNPLEEKIERDAIVEELTTKFNSAGGIKSIVRRVKTLLDCTLKHFYSNKYLSTSIKEYSDGDVRIYPVVRDEYKDHFRYTSKLDIYIELSGYKYKNDHKIQIKIKYPKSTSSYDYTEIERIYDIKDILYETRWLKIFKRYNIKYDMIMDDILESNKEEIDKYVSYVKNNWDYMPKYELKN